MNITCPNCGIKLELPDSIGEGQHLQCPECLCRFAIWNGECRVFSSEKAFLPNVARSAGYVPETLNPSVYEMTTISECRNFAWRRWAARMFDICLGGVFACLLTFTLVEFSGDSSMVLSFLKWLVQPQNRLFNFILGCGIVHFSDVVVFAIFGQTLGKKICGIRVCDADGNPIGRWAYFGRAWCVLLLGVGLMLPLVSVGTQLWQASRVGKGLPAAYDEGRVFQARPVRGKRSYDPALVIVSILTLILVFALMKG